jgi:hypothetical protein
MGPFNGFYRTGVLAQAISKKSTGDALPLARIAMPKLQIRRTASVRGRYERQQQH